MYAVIQTAEEAEVRRAARRSRRMSVTVSELLYSDKSRRERPAAAMRSTPSHGERASTAGLRRTSRATAASASPSRRLNRRTTAVRTG